MLPAWLPESLSDLMTRPLVAQLATIAADGGPHVMPVWFSTDGDQLLINTVEGRVKDANMVACDLVALVVADPDDSYRVVSLRGRAHLDDAGDRAIAHIDELANRYLGLERYPRHDPLRRRRMWRITPTKVVTAQSAADIK